MPAIFFAAFHPAPHHGYGRLTVESSQVVPRTPFLDNDLVALCYESPQPIDGTSLAVSVLRATPPALLDVPTDRGILGTGGAMRRWTRRLRGAANPRRGARALGLQTCHTTMLLVMGDGSDRPRVERAATALGVGDRVRFVGLVPRDRMAAHLALIDIGVVADDRTGYASPMKLLEYMAMGKPVVAPDLPNMRDLVSNGVEGLLFAPGDPRALAACLERLSDEALRARMGAQARARVERERNWTMNARTVVDAIGCIPARMDRLAG